MPIEPLLAWRPGYGATPVQAVRVVAGTTLETTQLGAATGLNATDPDLGRRGRHAANRIIEYRRDLYSIHGGSAEQGIYQFSFGPKTWAQVHAFANPPNGAGDDQSISGFNICVVNGVLRLYVFWQQSVSNNMHGAYTEDGTTWTPTASYATFSSWPREGFFYENRIYFAGEGTATNEYYAYDVISDSWADVPALGFASDPRNSCFINFQGRLFSIGGTNSTARGQVFFKELVAGSFIDVGFSGGTNPGALVGLTGIAASYNGAFAFEDAGNLYVVVQELTTGANDTTNNGQIRVHEFVPSGGPGSAFAENDISAAVVPADWRTGGAFETAFHSRGCLQGFSQLDNTTMVAEHFFWRHRDMQAEETSTFWEWNGNASLMTVSTSDVSRSVLIPTGPDKGGEWRYTDGEFDVTLEAFVVSPGKVQFDFQAHTPLDSSSPPLKNAKLYYALGDNDWAEATLSTDGGDAPSVVSGGDPAPGLSANTLTGITVGASVFRAVWDAGANGFTGGGARRRLRLRVFTP